MVQALTNVQLLAFHCGRLVSVRLTHFSATKTIESILLQKLDAGFLISFKFRTISCLNSSIQNVLQGCLQIYITYINWRSHLTTNLKNPKTKEIPLKGGRAWDTECLSVLLTKDQNGESIIKMVANEFYVDRISCFSSLTKVTSSPGRHNCVCSFWSEFRSFCLFFSRHGLSSSTTAHPHCWADQRWEELLICHKVYICSLSGLSYAFPRSNTSPRRFPFVRL